VAVLRQAIENGSFCSAGESRAAARRRLREWAQPGMNDGDGGFKRGVDFSEHALAARVDGQ